MKFHGTLEDLQAIIMQITSWPKWTRMRNQWQCRVPSGAVLNWWPSTGTIYVQGPDDAAAELEAALEDLVLKPMHQVQRSERKPRAEAIEVEYHEVRSIERGATLTRLPARLPKRT